MVVQSCVVTATRSARMAITVFKTLVVSLLKCDGADSNARTDIVFLFSVPFVLVSLFFSFFCTAPVVNYYLNVKT